jgi:hypothetical protein
MPEICTCGAQLPPDAVFCHKCGKPQRDIAAVAPEPPPEAPAPEAPAVVEPAPAAPPTFRNPVALRISLLVAVAATLLGWLPFLNWLAAGFFSVFFYRKKTRGRLNVNAGLHLGWITGVIMFGFWSLMFGALGVMGQLGKLFQEQFRNMPANDPSVQQFIHFLETGPGVFLMLAFGFVFITCFSMAGGALGAKMVGRGE